MSTNPDSQTLTSLETLTTNLAEILESYKAIHGDEYVQNLNCIFAIATQALQLENMLCDAHREVGFLLGESADNESAVAIVKSHHDTAHMMSAALMNALQMLTQSLESSAKNPHPSLDKNIRTLLQRCGDDYFSKIGAGHGRDHP